MMQANDTCAYCGAVLEDEESKDRGSHKACYDSYWSNLTGEEVTVHSREEILERGLDSEFVKPDMLVNGEPIWIDGEIEKGDGR
jgi:leucyl aminopeptidase (aminopeptidase T)